MVTEDADYLDGTYLDPEELETGVVIPSTIMTREAFLEIRQEVFREKVWLEHDHLALLFSALNAENVQQAAAFMNDLLVVFNNDRAHPGIWVTIEVINTVDFLIATGSCVTSAVLLMPIQTRNAPGGAQERKSLQAIKKRCVTPAVVADVRRTTASSRKKDKSLSISGTNARER